MFQDVEVELEPDLKAEMDESSEFEMNHRIVVHTTLPKRYQTPLEATLEEILKDPLRVVRMTTRLDHLIDQLHQASAIRHRFILYPSRHPARHFGRFDLLLVDSFQVPKLIFGMTEYPKIIHEDAEELIDKRLEDSNSMGDGNKLDDLRFLGIGRTDE